MQDFEVDAAFSMGLLRGERIRRWVPDLLATADIHLLPQRADAAALAQAIQTLAANPALCESLGAAGYLYAQAHLDSEAVLGRFEADLRVVRSPWRWRLCWRVR